MPQSLKEQFPFSLKIGTDDVTFLLDDGFTFSSVDPGGFEMCSFAVPRDLPQTLRGMPIRLDCGLEVAWEGRVSGVQRSLGNRTLITGEGYGARLKDTFLAEVYVDRDLTRWGSPSYARQAFLLGLQIQPGTATIAPDSSGQPAVIETISDAWSAPYYPTVEAWYDAGPENLIAKIYTDWTFAWNSTGLPPAFTNNIVVDQDNDTGNVLYEGVSLGGASYFNPVHRFRYALIQSTPAATPGGAAGFQWTSATRRIAVYGNHGLPGRGPDPVGFYTSDIAGHALSAVPGLQAGIIQPDSGLLIVPHAVYYTPVQVAQIVADMAKLSGNHWGVWPALSPRTWNALPRLDFRPRPQPGTFTASIRRDQCDVLDIHETLDGMYDSAQVTFTDAAGVPQAAAVSVDNPILDAVGLHRTVVLDAGVSTAAIAGAFGLIALALLTTQGRLTGSIETSTAIDGPGGPMPAWLLQPGIDRLRIPDLPSGDAWGAHNDLPIIRMEMSGSTSGFNTSLEIGQGANLVETLQSRLTAATTLVSGVTG